MKTIITTATVAIFALLVPTSNAQWQGFLYSVDKYHCPNFRANEKTYDFTYVGATGTPCTPIHPYCPHGNCSIGIEAVLVGGDGRSPSKVGVCKDEYCSDCDFKKFDRFFDFRIDCVRFFGEKYMYLGP